MKDAVETVVNIMAARLTFRHLTEQGDQTLSRKLTVGICLKDCVRS